MSLLTGTRRALLRGGAAGYSGKVLATGPIAYWIQGETTGAVAYCQISGLQNGAYTGVTLGQPGIGDGNTSPLYDGANAYTDVLTATFSAAFNGAEGTMMVWPKVSAVGEWTDGAARYGIQITNAAGEYARVYKSTVNNRISWRFRAGGANVGGDLNAIASVGWMHWAMTWDTVGNQVAYYYNGAPADAADAMPGVWAGALNLVLIGASSAVPNGVWLGTLAHCAIWDRALTPAKIAELAVL